MICRDGVMVAHWYSARRNPVPQKRPPSATRDGVGTAALRLCRGDCAICGWRFRTIGDFARCGGREFRAVRGAGVSLAAASGSFARCGGRPKALPLETAIF